MIKKAVIPAAGLGTRLLPLTKAQPKEMAPIIGKPIIQYIIEDLSESGIKNILIVTGKGKQAIENHFDRNTALEEMLKRKGKLDALEKIKKIDNLANIFYIRQKTQKGLGDAIYQGKDFINNEYFIAMVGDTLYKENLVKEMVNAYEKYKCSVIVLEEVPKHLVYKYGVIDGEKIEENVYNITNLIEKPNVEEAPSNLIITGAYLLSPKIFKFIEETPPGRGEEIQITDAIKNMLKEERVIGLVSKIKRYDIGDVEGWLKANIEMGIEEIPGFKEYLKGLVE